MEDYEYRLNQLIYNSNIQEAVVELIEIVKEMGAKIEKLEGQNEKF
ncbi:hypothetical protein UT300003_32820 [Clostridium sardiniense]